MIEPERTVGQSSYNSKGVLSSFEKMDLLVHGRTEVLRDHDDSQQQLTTHTHAFQPDDVSAPSESEVTTSFQPLSIPGMLESQSSIITDSSNAQSPHRNQTRQKNGKILHSVRIVHSLGSDEDEKDETIPSESKQAVVSPLSWNRIDLYGWDEEPAQRQSSSQKDSRATTYKNGFKKPQRTFDAYSPNLLTGLGSQKNRIGSEVKGNSKRKIRGKQNQSAHLNFFNVNFEGNSTLKLSQQGRHGKHVPSTTSSLVQVNMESYKSKLGWIEQNRRMLLMERGRKVHILRGRRGSKGKLYPMRDKVMKKGLTAEAVRPKSSNNRIKHYKDRRRKFATEHCRLPIQQLSQNKLPYISRASVDEIVWGVKEPDAPLNSMVDQKVLEIDMRPATAVDISIRHQAVARQAQQLWHASSCAALGIEDTTNSTVKGIPTRAAKPIHLRKSFKCSQRNSSIWKNLAKELMPLPESNHWIQYQRKKTRVGISRLHKQKKQNGEAFVDQRSSKFEMMQGDKATKASWSRQIGTEPSIQSLGESSLLSGGPSISSLSEEAIPLAEKPKFCFQPQKNMKRLNTPTPSSFTKPKFFSMYEGAHSPPLWKEVTTVTTEESGKRNDVLMVTGDQLVASTQN